MSGTLASINTTGRSNGGKARRRAGSATVGGAPGSGEQLRKLRLSCDGCYLAKIRCSKGQTCSRCASHNITCRYSASQRIGKPRRVPLGRGNPHPSPPASLVTTKSFDSAEPAAASPGHGSTMAPSLMSWDFGSASTVQDPDHTRMEQDLSYAWQQALDSIPSQGTALDQLQGSQMATFSINTNSAHSDPPWPASAPSVSPTALKLPQGDSIPLVPTAEDNKSPCPCSMTTFEVLQTLYDRSSSWQIPFDTMLTTSKDALARLSKVLACTCGPDPTLIMTLAANITKMMSWYQSICRSSSVSGASGGHSTPIILGMYRLEGEGEDLIKIQVVLSELKRLDILMTRFRERFEKVAPQQESEFVGELLIFLRRKLRDIVAGLQKELTLDFADVL